MILSLFNKSLVSLSDEKLMARIATKSDGRAFDELYQRYSRRLMGLFSRQLNGNHERAADLTQDTFLLVWTNRQRYRQGESFATWLFTIAYNLLKNEYRHAEQITIYTEHIKQTTIEGQDEAFEIKMDNEAFDEALKKELAKLDVDNRMLFSLRFEEEMTVPQIAVIMNIPEGTVKSRQHTLIRTLKERLKVYEVRR